MNYKVPVASKAKSTQDLSNSHVLSHNFGYLDVVRTQYMVPGDRMKFDLSAFTRLMPLPCPTYSNIKMVLRCFKVPFDFVIRDFSHFVGNDFLFDKDGAFTAQVPCVSPRDILCAFFQLGFIEKVSDVPLGGNADFYIITDLEGGGAGDAYNLTNQGRRVRSLLLQLGYKLPHLYVSDDIDDSSVSSLVAAQNDLLSLIPLLCFLKFYTDWVVPARFVKANFSFVLPFFDMAYYSGNFQFVASDGIEDSSFSPSLSGDYFEIDTLLDVLPAVSFLFDDYYSSAFVSPYGTESNLAGSTAGLVVPSVNTMPTAPDNTGIPKQLNTGDLNMISMMSIARLQQMVNRKKITDYHVLEWLKSEYGIAPSKEFLKMSEYLGSSKSTVQIGDIMATASTDSSVGTTVVGQFAGKGVAGSSASWTVESDCHCMCFITCELQTKTSYVQGLNPFMKCLTRESFWHPEFDNLGVRAISHRELVFDTFDSDIIGLWDDLDFSKVPAPNAIFGYAPRYSEFKHCDDMVSGDFVNPSVNKGLDSWYLSRKYKLDDNPVISLDFCSASNKSVGSQYDRIFQNTGDIDHFYSVFFINCVANRPMESITEYFEDMDDDSNRSIDVDNNNPLG